MEEIMTERSAREDRLMKKRALTILLIGLVLILGTVGLVQAEILPPRGEGRTGLQAVVLCETLTVRETAGANSRAVTTLKAGDTFIVTRQENGWAQCVLSDSAGAGPEGWVNTDYIAVDPAWYRVETAVPVYAWNDTSAPRIALLDRDTLLPVLKEDGDWLIVGLRGAAGWILK